MDQSIVRVEGLSHRYSRDWAIRGINFEIEAKGVVGLLGSNGAGKSTTMNILCGVLTPSEGSIWINGVDMRRKPKKAKMQIGFLPQTAPLYMDLTVDEYLRYAAQLRLMHRKAIPKAMEITKERCGINHFGKRLIRNLSGGYRQRVGIAQAIIHKPQLVVLDEPTNGLDPNQILEVRKMIREIGEERTVIFSSHILSEVQATCGEVIMIEGGKVVFANTLTAFNNYVEPDSLVVSLLAVPPPREFMSIPGITRVEPLSERIVRLKFDATPDIAGRVVQASVERGWQLQEIQLEKSSLEDIFAQLSKRNGTEKIPG